MRWRASRVQRLACDRNAERIRVLDKVMGQALANITATVLCIA
jgi:hypothetical protein